MTIDTIRLKGTKTLFAIHLITAYVIAVSLWVYLGTGSIYGVDVAHYKYNGFIYLIKDRFIDLIAVMLSTASLSAWYGIKRAKAVMVNGKSGAWLVLDVIKICVIMISIIGVIAYLTHLKEFSSAGIKIILMVQFTYAFIGMIIGAVTGPTLVIINFIWLKLISSRIRQTVS